MDLKQVSLIEELIEKFKNQEQLLYNINQQVKNNIINDMQHIKNKISPEE